MKLEILQNPLQHRKMIFLVSIAAILTDSLSYGQGLYVTPNTAVLNEGDRTDLLCNYGRKIDYCRIEIPGEQKALNLSPRWSKTPGFIYHGTTFEAGQCGVTIEHVKSTNNGQVKCTLGVEGDEVVGFIDLVVTLRPQQPIVELITKPDRDGHFQQGATLHARCVVRDGRPPANITWLLDQYPADKSTSPIEYVESPMGPNSTVSTSVQDIQWQLGPEDNGRKLICRSHHKTDRESVPPQEGAIQLLVRFPPVQQRDVVVYGLFLERTAMVNVTIQANPTPNIEWTVDGKVIPQGHHEDRFSAYEPQPLGHDFYNVTLAIAGLSLEDTTKTYQLRASNALGSTEYQVRISSSSTPPTAGLDIGAIVGIIVAVAVLILVILLIVFARATGRWCFGGKSVKSATNETEKDTEHQRHPGQSVALLETPNGVTIIPQPANAANSQDRNSVQRRRRSDYEDDSFEYATDRESSGVYNPTTMPLRAVMANAGGRNSQKGAVNNDSAENADLLERANKLGIPESRCSRWIPKGQREILEKQAKLLANHLPAKTAEMPLIERNDKSNANGNQRSNINTNTSNNTNTNTNSNTNTNTNTTEKNSIQRPLPTETEI